MKNGYGFWSTCKSLRNLKTSLKSKGLAHNSSWGWDRNMNNMMEKAKVSPVSLISLEVLSLQILRRTWLRLSHVSVEKLQNAFHCVQGSFLKLHNTHWITKTIAHLHYLIILSQDLKTQCNENWIICGHRYTEHFKHRLETMFEFKLALYLHHMEIQVAIQLWARSYLPGQLEQNPWT